MGERLKECALPLFGNANARIFHAEFHQRAGLRLAIDHALRIKVFFEIRGNEDLPFVGEFHRIAQKIEQDLTQARNIAAHPRRDIIAHIHQQLQALLAGARRAHIAGFFNRALNRQRLAL